MSTLERSPTPHDRRARVLAVDDHIPFLAVLRHLVRATARLELVGEAESGEQAIEAARRLRPDLVLIDVRMPGMGGIAAAERIKADRPATLVVLISTTHPDALPRSATAPLADAIIWKSELEPELLDNVWLRARHDPPPSASEGP